MKASILVILLNISISLSISAQENTEKSTKAKIELVSPLDRLYPEKTPDKKSVVKQRLVFSVEKLPLFCKIEHKLAKSSKVNVMMRLGSLDYVNKLEGKGTGPNR